MAYPSQLFAGDTWTIKHTQETIDPVIQLRMHLNSSVFQFTSDAVVSTDGEYSFVISKELSSTFAPGDYVMSITSLKDGSRSTITTGNILTIEPDPAVASSMSHARRMVNALEGLISGRLSSSHALYSSLTYEGRSVTQLSPVELYRALQVYKDALKAEVQAENMGKGFKNNKNKILIGFK